MARSFVPGRRVQSTALRLLWLAIGITVASIALNLLVPTLGPTVQAVLFVAVMAVVLVGLWRGLGRADVFGSARPSVWFAVIAIPYVAWLGLIWTLALQDTFTFRLGGRIPLLPLAILLPLVIGLPLLLRSRRMAAVLDAIPASWLIGVQVYRVFGSIFVVNWVLGAGLSGIFAWPAGAGDTLVGLLALPVAAYAQANPYAVRGWAVAWNVLGVLDLVDAIILGFLSTPGPFQLIGVAASGPSPLTVYPLVMIPAFAVPSSILLHALSLRQLRRLERRRAVAAPLANESVRTSAWVVADRGGAG